MAAWLCGGWDANTLQKKCCLDSLKTGGGHGNFGYV